MEKKTLAMNLHDVVRRAVKQNGYNSKLLNDKIGKTITVKLLSQSSATKNISLLYQISKLQFKPIYIELVEKFITTNYPLDKYQ
jgi:ribosome-binding protein aMBF1 (putative translation factor)